MDDLESARLQLLLGMAFGPGLQEGQSAWRDVPDVVRRSFLLLAKELRRLHRLLAANLQDPNPALQRVKDPDLQDQLVLLRTQVQDAQDQADARHRRTQHKLSSLWGEVAATAEAAADATSERFSANWETQVELLQRRMDEQDRTCRTQDQQVDQALHELQKGHVLCWQDLRRLQRQFAAHDHRVVGTTVQKQQDGEEVRPAEPFHEGGRTRKKQDRAGRVLLHLRDLETLKQQQDRGGLSPVAEHGVSASG